MSHSHHHHEHYGDYHLSQSHVEALVTNLGAWNWNAFLMATISGLSTGVGGILVLIYGQPNHTKLGHLLSFSAGVMLYISFMDLLPEANEEIGFAKANFWFFVGMLIFGLIAHLFPDHDHTTEKIKNKKMKSADGKLEERQLRRVGLITALGISLHNVPEGIAVYLACLKGLEIGLPLMIAIAAHNIPEGMAVASPMYHSTRSKWQALKYSILSGVCEPLGALVFGVLFTPYMTNATVQSLLAAVAGVMVLVSLRELIPVALKYLKPEPAIFSNALGMIFISISIYCLHYALQSSKQTTDENFREIRNIKFTYERKTEAKNFQRTELNMKRM
jgi:ZIP family zinc transporter